MRWLCPVLISAMAFAQGDPAALYREGVDRQRAGDMAGAANLYRQVLKTDAGNVAARSNLGAALASQGLFDEAVPEYEAALKSAPAAVRPVLRRNLALAYYKSGRMEQAAPLLLELHAQMPGDMDAALLAADCLLQMGDARQAAGLLEPMAAQAAGDRAFAWVLGNAYLKTGRTGDAQRMLDPILKDTTSAEGNYALGLAMFGSGDYPAAVKALARALELNAGLPHAQSYYGQALLFTGDPDAALEAFGKQLAADANDFDANFRAATIFDQRKAFAKAEPLLRRAVRLRPESAEARYALGETLAGQNKADAAKLEFEGLIQKWPEFGAAHARLGELYAKAGMLSAAAKERALGARYEAKTPESGVGTGPKVGNAAPNVKVGGVNLASARPGKPTVLVFGSYSCPNFRSASPVLNALAKEYGGNAAFLLVYIREAHSADQWQSTRNLRESIQLAPAASNEQKHEYAAMCQRKLHLQFDSVVDGLDNEAERAYAAWPSKVVVIAANGTVRYSSGLSEQEFDAAALRGAVLAVLK